MKATVLKWSEVQPGDTVVMQGTLMKFLREDDSDPKFMPEEMRFLVMDFAGNEMHTGVYNDWLVAVVEREDESSGLPAA